MWSFNLTGLAAGTKYYVRAYAINTAGTAYGNEMTVIAAAPGIYTTTAMPSALTAYTGGGNVQYAGTSPVTALGTCWSTAANPTVADSKSTDTVVQSGGFSSTLTSLVPGTTYYYRAYGTNTYGTNYGPEYSLIAGVPAVLSRPSVTSSAADGSTANASIAIADNFGVAISDIGFCWSSTNMAPTLADSHTSGTLVQSGSFTSTLTGLSTGTRYNVRAYATNTNGTFYSTATTYTAVAAVVAPTLSTTAVSSIAATSATAGGSISATGGAAITANGVCWSTSTGPTVDLSTKTTDSAVQSGAFSSSLTGLTASTTYYVRAYATNSVGTGYGSEVSFTTAAASAGLATLANTQIQNSSATVAGGWALVSDIGGSAITAEGVCWSTAANPTLADSSAASPYLAQANGMLSFSITGLTAGTTYHARPYATNAAGTAYGPEVTFVAGTPAVTTGLANSSSATSALVASTVTSTAGSSLTAVGICWSTTSNPSLTDSHTSDTIPLYPPAIYNSSLTGLTAGTTYHYRAYVTNAIGTTYGQDATYVAGTPGLSLGAINLTSADGTTGTAAATVNGYGSTITAMGICWGPTPPISLPTLTDSHTSETPVQSGSFTSNLTGLTLGSLYNFRAYATNAYGTAYSTPAMATSTKPDTVPILSATAAASSITQTSATSGGTIDSIGGNSQNLSAWGICWNTSPSPTTSNSKTTNLSYKLGSFTNNLTGLTAGTTYYVRAYATNGLGVGYGPEISFTTGGAVVTIPTVSTDSGVSATYSGITIYGTVQSSGGGTLTGVGVCWGPSANPDINGSHTTSAAVTGFFGLTITGLTPLTTYHARAYATNSAGTGYGNDYTFTTYDSVAPFPATTAATSISSQGATVGGSILDNGGATITENGIAWSATNSNPTVSDNKTTDTPVQSGAFTHVLTGLAPGTTYYYRAYGTNRWGTRYGTALNFTTSAVVPTLSTTAVSSIAATTATSGGSVSATGGATISAVGVCWSTSTGPTVDLSTKTTDSAVQSGVFTSSLTGLTASTTYYVRAYATNSAGTAYGPEVSFTTAAPVGVPTVLTWSVTTMSLTTATVQGLPTSVGTSPITANGVCWSTSPSPTTSSSKTTEPAVQNIFFTSN